MKKEFNVVNDAYVDCFTAMEHRGVIKDLEIEVVLNGYYNVSFTVVDDKEFSNEMYG